jgi:hypothetical protein
MTDEVFIPEPVSQVLRLYDGLVDESAWDRMASEQIERLAARLLQGHRTRVPGAAVELHNWLPDAGRRSTQELFDLALSIDDALGTVSRAHGFSSWRSAASDGRRRGDPDFERAVEDLLAGNIPALVGPLEGFEDLVVRRSHYGHRATLLHYLAANGVETYRQRVPRNASKIARLLLQRGADPLATANMYGDNRTTKGMLISSSHPAEAGVTHEVLAVLDGTSGERSR